MRRLSKFWIIIVFLTLIVLSSAVGTIRQKHYETYETYENNNTTHKPHVAICYWGLTTSTHLVYETHQQRLFDVLAKADIDYDVFMHTWKIDKEMRWDDDTGTVIEVNRQPDENVEDYRFLKPHKYNKDNQDEFLQSINFADYFNQELYDKYGNSEHEWKPELIRNHLCALESQKRVTQMCMDEGRHYDFVIYMRPDAEIKNDFPVWIINDMKEGEIAIPNHGHWEGLNDKFAVVPYIDCWKYGKRIDEIVEYRRTQGKIQSEGYAKYIMNKYFTHVHFLDFAFDIRKNKS